jgi:hypothetical protein
LSRTRDCHNKGCRGARTYLWLDLSVWDVLRGMRQGCEGSYRMDHIRRPEFLGMSRRGHYSTVAVTLTQQTPPARPPSRPGLWYVSRTTGTGPRQGIRRVNTGFDSCNPTQTRRATLASSGPDWSFDSHYILPIVLNAAQLANRHVVLPSVQQYRDASTSTQPKS